MKLVFFSLVFIVFLGDNHAHDGFFSCLFFFLLFLLNLCLSLQPTFIGGVKNFIFEFLCGRIGGFPLVRYVGGPLAVLFYFVADTKCGVWVGRQQDLGGIAYVWLVIYLIWAGATLRVIFKR